MCDKAGVIWAGRTEHMDPVQGAVRQRHARRARCSTRWPAPTSSSGLSAAGAMTAEMVAAMGANPIIFALANPMPEILPEQVRAVRDDAIVATGRSATTRTR